MLGIIVALIVSTTGLASPAGAVDIWDPADITYTVRATSDYGTGWGGVQWPDEEHIGTWANSIDDWGWDDGYCLVDIESERYYTMIGNPDPLDMEASWSTLASISLDTGGMEAFASGEALAGFIADSDGTHEQTQSDFTAHEVHELATSYAHWGDQSTRGGLWTKTMTGSFSLKCVHVVRVETHTDNGQAYANATSSVVYPNP